MRPRPLSTSRQFTGSHDNVVSNSFTKPNLSRALKLSLRVSWLNLSWICDSINAFQHGVLSRGMIHLTVSYEESWSKDQEKEMCGEERQGTSLTKTNIGVFHFAQPCAFIMCHHFQLLDAIHLDWAVKVGCHSIRLELLKDSRKTSLWALGLSN